MRKSFSPELPTMNARKILTDCSVPIGSDFFTLSPSQVCSLLEYADMARYRKPKQANGSRGRYWHAYLQRKAQRVTVSDARANLRGAPHA